MSSLRRRHAAIERVRHRRAARGAGQMREQPGRADGDAGIAGHRRHPQMQARLALLVLREPGLIEMLEQPHVADRVQRHAAGQHQPARAGDAQQVIDDMDHGVLEHQLRRGGLVEAVLGVGPVMDVLDAQHRVGIPELLGLERLAEDIDQRLLVGMIEGVAVPVGHRAIEPDLAVVAEMQHVLQPRVIGIGRAVHVAPGGGAHVAAFAGEPGPAALGRGDHAVEHAERIEHAVVAVELAHRAVLGDIERDRALIAGAVEHRDRDRLAVVGKGRCGKRKPGVVVVVRHADQRHALRQARAAAREFSACASSGRGGGRRKPAASVVRSSLRLCGTSSSTERTSVPASVG